MSLDPVDASVAAPPVRLERSGPLAHLTLDRPHSGNALDLDLGLAFHTAARDLAASADEIGAVLLTAEGPNFCVGGDLRDFAKADDPTAYVHAVAEQMHAALHILTTLPAPVITAAQGAIAGGGVGLALTGDLVIAARSARFRLAYTAGGLAPDCGASWLLPRLIGLPRAMHLALTNPVLPAETAERWGLISLVVDDPDLPSRAQELAETLANGPRQSQAETKRLLRSALTTPYEPHLADEARTIAHLAATPDGREGVKAFLEKRPPTFTRQPPAASTGSASTW